jgi:hypothetical protein
VKLIQEIPPSPSFAVTLTTYNPIYVGVPVNYLIDGSKDSQEGTIAEYCNLSLSLSRKKSI